MEEALQAVDKAIELNPRNSSIWTSKAIAFYYLGKYEESIQAYDKAIEIDPEDGWA